VRRYSRRDFIRVTAAGSAAAYLAAACGGDDDGGNGAPASPAAGTSVTGASPVVTAGADAGAVGLRWYGQAMFVLTSPGGTTVLLDPFNEIGYAIPPPLNTDAATITHEHPDHNNAALGGGAALMRGLTTEGWADIDETFGDVRIRIVRTFHDASQGSERGRNAAFLFDMGGMRFAHMGDLGHVLDDEQRAQVGAVDVLMIPVGGTFTLDAAGATEVTTQLAPKLVFPMHYKTDRINLPLATADAFLDGKNVQRVGSTTVRVSRESLPAGLTAYVLDYE
jgi:L-ascorbate metabolism protein UlaG (beta-lactamase superfamily)